MVFGAEGQGSWHTPDRTEELALTLFSVVS
jgi:hypothetical protein